MQSNETTKQDQTKCAENMWEFGKNWKRIIIIINKFLNLKSPLSSDFYQREINIKIDLYK